MSRSEWKRKCAEHLATHGKMDKDAAASCAEDCAALEESYNPSTEFWSSPVEAAQAEINSWKK